MENTGVYFAHLEGTVHGRHFWGIRSVPGLALVPPARLFTPGSCLPRVVGAVTLSSHFVPVEKTESWGLEPPATRAWGTEMGIQAHLTSSLLNTTPRLEPRRHIWVIRFQSSADFTLTSNSKRHLTPPRSVLHGKGPA